MDIFGTEWWKRHQWLPKANQRTGHSPSPESNIWPQDMPSGFDVGHPSSYTHTQGE